MTARPFPVAEKTRGNGDVALCPHFRYGLKLKMGRQGYVPIFPRPDPAPRLIPDSPQPDPPVTLVSTLVSAYVRPIFKFLPHPYRGDATDVRSPAARKSCPEEDDDVDEVIPHAFSGYCLLS